MVLEKKTLATAYVYVALFVLAVCTCLKMYGQESDNGSSIVNAFFAFTFLIWGMSVFKVSSDGYLIEKPSTTIVLFNIYFAWTILITAIMPPEGVKLRTHILNVMFMALPMIVMNMMYYFVKRRGSSRHLLWAFFVIALMFVMTYASFYDTDNILMNVHLGSSYYALYILPLVMMSPSKVLKIGGLIIVSFAVFSSVKRGGVLALLMGALVYVVVQQSVTTGKSKLMRIVILIFLVSLLAVVFLYIGTLGDNDIFERFEDLEEDSGSGRLFVWAETWRVINDQDIFGYIVGNGYNAVVGVSRYVLSAHNDYLEAWYDFGLIGFIFYVSAVLSLLFRNLQSIRMRASYAPAFSMMSVLIIILSMISHIAIYFWMNIVMLNVAYFIGRMDYERKRIDAE